MLTLEQFFRATPAYGWVWGETDCLTWVACWAMQRGHPDPAGPYRGTYRSRRAAMRFVRDSGGLFEVARQGADRAGLMQIPPDEAVSGDIGVGRFSPFISARGELVGMIRAGANWAVLTAAGAVLIGPAEAIAAWRL